MKSQNLKLLSFISLIMIVFTGCGGLGKMEKYLNDVNFKLTPNPLVVKGDSVEVKITGTFPPKYFHKKVAIDATPVLVYEGGETSYKMEGFQGEDAAGNATVVPYLEGKGFTYNDRVAYSSSMETSELMLKITGRQGNKTKEFEPYKIGDGVITTPLLVMSDDKVLLGEDEFTRITSHQMEGIIHYLVNSSTVRGSELRDEDIKAIKDFIKAAKEDAGIKFTGSQVMAYASPDGEITLNEDLADDRASSANKFVRGELKKIKAEGAMEDAFYKNMPKGEDWDGFKELMMKSDIEDKELILRILEMYSDVNKREQEIKNLAATYVEVAEKILPDLRRSQISLMYDKVGKSDEEISSIAKTNPDELNVEEILYAATLTNDMNEKLEIYKAAERVHTSDWRGANNVGYIYMMQNKLNDAEAQFEKSNGISENPYAMNNLGVVARLKGDRNKARELFESSSAAGAEVNYNLGIVEIQDGNYESAVSSMGSFNTFNMALARLLNEDPEGALQAIDASEDKDSGMGYYLRAIIGARTGNTDMLNSNLKKAIAKDPALKSKAASDLEFMKYRENADFMAAVN